VQLQLSIEEREHCVEMASCGKMRWMPVYCHKLALCHVDCRPLLNTTGHMMSRMAYAACINLYFHSIFTRCLLLTLTSLAVMSLKVTGSRALCCKMW